jgi:hypothetical protein
VTLRTADTSEMTRVMMEHDYLFLFLVNQDYEIFRRLKRLILIPVGINYDAITH